MGLKLKTGCLKITWKQNFVFSQYLCLSCLNVFVCVQCERDCFDRLLFIKYSEMSSSLTKPTKWHVPSEDSDQPGHLPSLIRVFAVCSWVVKDATFHHADSKDCDHDQIGWMARLIWVFTGRTRSFCWFCHAAAQMFSAGNSVFGVHHNMAFLRYFPVLLLVVMQSLMLVKCYVTTFAANKFLHIMIIMQTYCIKYRNKYVITEFVLMLSNTCICARQLSEILWICRLIA